MITSISSQGNSLIMGSVCSCKSDHYADENATRRGFSSRYFKFGSSKWIEPYLFLPAGCCQFRRSSCPSLMELCIHKICEVIYSFSRLHVPLRDFMVEYLCLLRKSYVVCTNRTLTNTIHFQCSRVT